MTRCEGQRVELGLPVQRVSYEESHDRHVHAALRRKPWSAFIAALNDSRLPYCLLGAPAGVQEASDSDVDFAVRPCDYRRIPQLLAAAAASVGGLLVQAIEHETAATYFALALQQHGHVAFLHPDCTTDYRRQGRLWMSSDELLHGRRLASMGYYRPAPDVDFKYYLTKQVLKQTVSDTQWRKLVMLYHAVDDPREALSWWRLATAAQIEQCLLRNNCEEFRTLLPHVRNQLITTPAHESLTARTSSFVGRSARVVRRVANATGLFAQISSGTAAQRTALASALANTLAPAFRRASISEASNPATVLRALVASTLVVSTAEAIPFRTLFGGVDIHWQQELAESENLESAVATILSHLSQRTLRRLQVPSPLSQPGELDTLAHTAVS